MESVLFPIVSKINEYLSNYILIFLLMGVGLWYSIKHPLRAGALLRRGHEEGLRQAVTSAAAPRRAA